MKIARHLVLCALVLFGYLEAVDWKRPVEVAQSTVPRLAVDLNGNAVAVWVYSDDNESYIQAATQPYKGSWSSPVRLSYVSGVALEADLVLDLGGNAVAIWTIANDDNAVVYSATLPVGQKKWIPATDPLSSSTVNAEMIQLQVNDRGDAMAMWVASHEDDRLSFQGARLPIGSKAWTPLLDNFQHNLDDFSFALDKNGDAVLVWGEFPSTTYNIKAATLTHDVLAWSSETPLSTYGIPAIVPSVLLDPSGNAIAIWQEPSKDVCESALLPSGKTNEWISLPFPDVKGWVTSMNIDAEGNATALIACFTGDRFMATTLPTGKPDKRHWTSPATIMESNAYRPISAIDTFGNILAVWVDPVTLTIQSSIHAIGSTSWSQPQTLPYVKLEDRDDLWYVCLSSKNSTDLLFVTKESATVNIMNGYDVFPSFNR